MRRSSCWTRTPCPTRGALHRPLGALVLALTLSGCDCWPLFSSPEHVDVRPLFLAAVRSPDRFDDQIPGLSPHERASECLRQRADVAFDEEESQLRECSVILTGSPAWNECHERAEALHNNGVILGDVAAAVEGSRSFAQSSGGQYLILTRLAVGDALYSQVVALIEEVAPPMECELDCR